MSRSATSQEFEMFNWRQGESARGKANWKVVLRLNDLESRDVPAQWFAVHLDSPALGVPGSSDRTVTAGGLATSSDYPPDADVTVEAETAADAVRLALGGEVETGGEHYMLISETLGNTAADHAPFLLVPTDAGFEVRLEDLAATPAVSDWDYNDAKWAVSVNFATAPPPKPAPAPAPAPDPRTAPVEVDPKTIETITKGKVGASRIDPNDPTNTQIEISISGGHTEGSTPTTAPVEVGTGTARRIVTVTIKPVPVDKKIDSVKEVHEVDAEGTASDPGPPKDATEEDKKKSPIVTKVVPVDGKVKNVRKTVFPSGWDDAKVEAAIKKAGEEGQKSGKAPEWEVTDPKVPTKGTGVVTVDGVKISFSWELRGTKLVITHANPVK